MTPLARSRRSTVKPVDVGQHPVEHDHVVGRLRRSGAMRGHAVRRDVDDVALGDQDAPDERRPSSVRLRPRGSASPQSAGRVPGARRGSDGLSLKLLIRGTPASNRAGPRYRQTPIQPEEPPMSNRTRPRCRLGGCRGHPGGGPRRAGFAPGAAGPRPTWHQPPTAAADPSVQVDTVYLAPPAEQQTITVHRRRETASTRATTASPKATTECPTSSRTSRPPVAATATTATQRRHPHRDGAGRRRRQRAP